MTLKYCDNCKEYTLNDTCIKCGKPTINKKPGKFNPDKNYALQRLKVKGQL
ncbi:Ribosome biogenesis protein Nop10 [Candidatus Tiddalikarchaeum anstoanum]|nr:Ribosome biogenesis protein Nop10 [Candidatus Tiddalikarchaeum anstoanum]